MNSDQTRLPTRLPVRLDPFKFADQGKEIDAILSVEYLDRFAQELNSSKGEVQCHIKGVKSGNGIFRSLHVVLTGEVELICQGCTDAFMYQVDRKAIIYPVYSEEQAKQVPDDGEPVLLDEDSSKTNLDIKSAIEDELILSLPLIPLYGECEALDTYQVGDIPEETPEEVEKNNPFSALKNIELD